MTIKNSLKLQVFALLFAAIISPLSTLAATNSKQATIEFVLGTYEVPGVKAECAPSYYGGTITGIGTGTITVNGISTSLGVLSLRADDCITPMKNNRFTAEGNLTLTASNGDNIKAHYYVSFVPTKKDSPIYKYENFTLQEIEGTGLFEIATGSAGIVEGASNIDTGLGFVEGIINISK